MNSSFYAAQTEDDFSKARNKALFNEIQHFMNPEEATLISFTDIKSLLKPKDEVYMGMKTIPVDKIVGSEGRYKDFDNQFFPKSNFLKERWEHVDEAAIQAIMLPPVKVYELAGLYFVRDGNHRVSVAKMRGTEFIDAEVVSLQSEIKLRAMDTLKGMVRQIIFYEKRVFYSETNFGDITDFWGLDFSTAGQYDVVYNHILTHKYYLNLKRTDEISMEDAIISWYTTVYSPIIDVIKKKHVMRYFKHRTESDLYVWIIKYWDELKKKFGNDFKLDDAVASFRKKERYSFLNKLINMFQRILVKRSIKSS
ncbi:MAG TPA: transcriptional regulator [Treponema sp.]|nr:transcriptional regulator [Treponema sp.]